MDNPSVLLWIVPILVILFFATRISFIRLRGEEWRSRRKVQRWLFLSRALIYLLLLLALAGPFSTHDKLAKGEESLLLLLDNSSSFSVFDPQVGENLREKLEDRMQVKVSYVGDADKTPLGDSILEQLQEGGNILLVSDGHNNYGAELNDIVLRAADIGGGIHALALTPVERDTALVLRGPDKVSPGVKNVFSVQLSGTAPGAKQVVVDIDGEVILDTITEEKQLSFIKEFAEGTHRITAKLIAEDYFSENNVYYKTVKVIPKPRILFYSEKSSPLVNILQQLYAVEVVSSLTSIDKTSTYAVVINDVPAARLTSTVPLLTNYLSDDNGVLVIGGESSFDQGEYKGSKFEDMLPTRTGVAEKKDESEVNIVVTLDMSLGARLDQYGQSTIGDVQKAIAISVIENLKETHNVGVVAFRSETDSSIISPLSPLQDKKEELINTIARLKGSGNAHVPAGLTLADKTLGSVSKGNIIIISDGRSGGMVKAQNFATSLHTNKDITTYGVGVGDPCLKYNKKTKKCERWSDSIYGVNAIKAIAEAGGGTYFHGEQAPQRVKILFGDPSDASDKDSFSLKIKDDTHFITRDLQLKAKITGFNNVLPKGTAHLLVTTDTGEPIVTVWRHGVGRVASLATDDGTLWAGNLLRGEDSLVLTKTLNWLIGDPEKKSKSFVYVQDTNLGRSTDVLVKGEEAPKGEGLTFYKKGEQLHSANFVPTQLGFQTKRGVDFAVNYNKELEAIGIDSSLQNLVTATGGNIYKPEDIEELIAQVSTPTTQPVSGKWHYSWVLVLFALLLFLIELAMRRLGEYKHI